MHKFYRAERSLEGRRLQGTYTYGKIGIHPAQVPQKICWDGKAEFIQLCLAPTMLRYFVEQDIDSNCAELLPQVAVDDTLVYGIGLALKTELESYPTDNHLYVESATTLLTVHLLQHYGVKKISHRQYVGGLSRSKLQRVLDYIYAHLDQDLSLVELAALSLCS